MKNFLLSLTMLIVSCGPQPFVADNDMKQITDKTASLDVEIGEKIYYQGQEHGSVGKRIKLTTEDEHILKIIKVQQDYKNPNWESTDGGDQATKTFVMEAKQTGNTTMTIRHLYRGDVQKEQTVHCRVQ